MKIAILPRMSSLRGSSPRGTLMLSGCLLLYFALCLLTTLPAAAQAGSVTPFSADLDGYAKLDFYVPTGVTVEAQSLEDLNYTEGREIKAVLLVNGSRVSLHLLYPCQAPAAKAEPNAIKAAINAYNSGVSQTVYNPTPLNISGQSALWGQVGNQIVVAYQPSVQTIALVLIDESLDENSLEYLLGSLKITVTEGKSLLFPGYCPDTSISETSSAKAAGESAATAAESKLFGDEDMGPEVGTGTTPTVTTPTVTTPAVPAPAPSSDSNAGIASAQKMLDAMKRH